MRCGQRLMECRLRGGNRRALGEQFRGNTIRCQRLPASQPQPLIDPGGIAETTDGDQFVIASQEHGFMRGAMADQSIDGFPGPPAAVDIVAEKNVDRSRHRTVCLIRFDPAKQLVEQVETAMNVADGVDPGTLRKRRLPPRNSWLFAGSNG